MSKPIFDPDAPLHAQLADSVSKGFLSAVAAEQIRSADAWLIDKMDDLQREYPNQAITVVPESTMASGFATYVGPTSYESENKARQFSPGIAYVTLEPRIPFGVPINDGVWSQAVFESVLDSPLLVELAGGDSLLQANEEEKKKKEAADKVIRDLEKLLEDGTISDKDLIGAFPAKLVGGGAFVGGLISDGKHKNLKLWHIDTGASVSCISRENFERLQKKGAQPKQEGEVEVQTADGVKKYPKYSGIPMSFGRKKKDGTADVATCDVPLLVTSSDLLGLDQLKKTGTKVIIDPAGDSAELVER